jgi:hypothetical protein
MKTIFIAAALALTTMSVSANKTSAKDRVSVKATSSFQNEFGRVDNVTWSPAANNMLRATFTQNDETVNAFFDQKGEYVATTIALTKDQLPSKLRAAISKQIKDGVVTEALEMQSDDEIAYYVKVYADGSEKLYKGSSTGTLAKVDY